MKTYTIILTAMVLALNLMLPNKVQSQSYNYLGTYNNLGVPNYLIVNDTVSQAFLNNVKASLPENYPVPTFNPQYISSNTETDIKLKDQADVWVTFVEEGAGYRNVLGFYTYPLNAPRTTTPHDSDITIIFPNVSKLYSGGGLLTGNKVHIGNFPANTGIGWVLIANGWNGSSVGNGNWKLFSNPAFNPERDTTLRFHNVLLQDTSESCILLGFEDIRRDYSSCDNDFNDAIFYVTANPDTAIIVNQINSITTSTGSVSSGNNGGLESNGSLAQKIALRNFKRNKQEQTDYDNPENLVKFEQLRPSNYANARLKRSGVIASLIPENGLIGAEAFVTSPADLLDITNAEEVLSVDYFQANNRTGSVLALATSDHVYDHAKVICNRLNGGKIESIEITRVGSTPFILSKIINGNGDMEYTISFSIIEQDDQHSLECHWNLEQYSEGEDIYTFQVWGTSPVYVKSIVEKILEKSDNLFSNLSLPIKDPELPELFVQAGNYQNGNLGLHIYNNKGVDAVNISGSLCRAEGMNRESFNEELNLNGNSYEYLQVPFDPIFDIGLSITSTKSNIPDVTYFADGAWGVDHDPSEVIDHSFEVYPELNSNDEDDKYFVERGISFDASVQTYYSIFRTLKPSNVEVDLSEYNALSFEANGNTSLKVTIMKKGVNEWGKQFSTTIQLNEENEVFELPFTQFKNNNGDEFSPNDVVSVIFSVTNKSDEPVKVNFSLKALKFESKEFVNNGLLNENESTVYPNPISDVGFIQFNSSTEESAMLTILDATNKPVFQTNISITEGLNSVEINRDVFSSGVYFYQIESSTPLFGKFVMK